MGPEAQKKTHRSTSRVAPGCSDVPKHKQLQKLNPAKSKTAQLRLTKDRLKAQRVTLQKLEEWLRTTQGSITGTERFHLASTSSSKWIIHPTIEEPFRGMLSSSPPPALSAAAVGIPFHNHWVRFRHGFLKKAMTQFPINVPVLEATTHFQRGKLYCRLLWLR